MLKNNVKVSKPHSVLLKRKKLSKSLNILGMQLYKTNIKN